MDEIDFAWATNFPEADVMEKATQEMIKDLLTCQYAQKEDLEGMSIKTLTQQLLAPAHAPAFVFFVFQKINHSRSSNCFLCFKI